MFLQFGQLILVGSPMANRIASQAPAFKAGVLDYAIYLLSYSTLPKQLPHFFDCRLIPPFAEHALVHFVELVGAQLAAERAGYG